MLSLYMWEWQSLPITNYMFFPFHNLRNNHIIVCISSLILYSLPLHSHITFSSMLLHLYWCCLVVPKPHIPNVNYLTISLLLLLLLLLTVVRHIEWEWEKEWGFTRGKKRNNKLNDKMENEEVFFCWRFIYLFHIRIL